MGAIAPRAAGLLWALAAAGGCRSVDIFENNAPQVESVNGLPYLNILGAAIPNGQAAAGVDWERFHAVPGASLSIEVVASDPERRPLKMWFPRAPDGWVFDPDATVGRWEVPESIPPEVFNEGGVYGVIDDPVPSDPREREFFIPLWWDDDADTGYPGP